MEKLNIPIIDLQKDLFSVHNDPKSLFPRRMYGHYNELGYRLAAETIFKIIRENENIKWSTELAKSLYFYLFLSRAIIVIF